MPAAAALPPMRAAHAAPWRAAVLLWLGLLWALAPAQAQTAAPASTSTSLLTIDSALRADGSGAAFPATAAAQRVALPDAWGRGLPAGRGAWWYRVELPPLRDDGVLQALFIERVCGQFEVFLNGQPLHSGAGLSATATDHCMQPQLLTLPSTLWRRDANRLDLRVVGLPLAEVGSRRRAGGLSTLVVGPRDALAARHARLSALQVWAPLALSATLLLLGANLFVLGLLTRRESPLAAFGALGVGWALLEGGWWQRHLPLALAQTEFLACVLLGFITWAAVQFLLRHAGLRHRLADIGLPLQCALLALSLVLAGPQRLQAVASAWQVLLAGEVAAAAAWHLHRARQGPGGWPMAALLGLAAAAGALEFAAQSSTVALPSSLARSAQFAQLLLQLAWVTIGLRLVLLHGRALQHAEQDPTLLAQRVSEATVEIEHNFRQLAERHVEQVTERERKRIAADLHDDLGAKLLTIVHTSDSERISTLAREALEEMRLSVRGLTGRPVRLADALGDWRAEVVLRLGQAGIEGEWEAPEDLPQTLSARAYVQTTRILREATSNVIKHSAATSCTVRATITGNDFQFVVEDNGVGISGEADGRLDRGHGLASMKNRARQLQGQCLVESRPGHGTVIRLTVPLDRATEPS